MEAESLHTSDHSETVKPGPSRKPASYKDAQVWKDIEAETGYAPFKDYGAFSCDYDGLRRYPWERFEDSSRNKVENILPGDARNRTVLYDLSTHENSAKLSRRCYCDSGTELIQALRKPPEGSRVQIVLCKTAEVFMNEEMDAILTLGLKLELYDFEYRDDWAPPPTKSGFQSKSIFGQQTVAAMSQSFTCDSANEVPVVIVATVESGDFGRRLARSASISDPQHLKARPSVILLSDDTIETTGQVYAMAVQHFIEQYPITKVTKPYLLLVAISPLLYVEACRLKEAFRLFQGCFTESVLTNPTTFFSTQRLNRLRLELRRLAELTEGLLGQVSRHIAAHTDLHHQHSYMNIMADLRSLVADARRLDAEFRDFKQI